MALMLRALALLFLLTSTRAAAQESEIGTDVELPADWTGRSARVAPRAHGQVALFAESRIGLGHELQIGAHLAGFAALCPHAALLYRVLKRGPWQASARLGSAYPYPTLWLLTGEGAGALLPGDTKPQQGLIFDLGGRASLALPRAQLLTFEAALQVAATWGHSTSPLLDFPFLYPRFAALDAPLTARLSATGEGVIAAGFRWVGALDAWILPVVTGGFALEPRAGFGWLSARRVGLELGYRASYARYPVGLRFQGTPYFDIRVSF